MTMVNAVTPPQRTIIMIVVLLLAGIAAHITSMRGTFVFDDYGDIIQNERVHGLGQLDVIVQRARRPLTEITFAINYSISELETWSYHIVNIGIHLLTGIALLLLTQRLLEPIGDRLRVDTNIVAFVAVLFWIVHPLSTATVTYIVQRAESLASLFYVVTLLCWTGALRSPRAWRWLTVAVISTALGLASKAIVVTVPAMILILEWLHRGEPIRVRLRRRGIAFAGVIAAGLVLLLTDVAQGVLSTSRDSATVGYSYDGVSPRLYALTQTQVILHYLRLVVWPSGMAIDYNWPAVNGIGDVWLEGAVIMALLGGTIWLLARRWTIAVFPAMFFIVLAPTSSIVPIRDLANDHRAYLPSFGVIALIVIGGAWLGQRWLSAVSPRVRLINTLLIMMSGVSALTAATNLRASKYQTRTSLWADVLDVSPSNPRALLRLGTDHEAKGRLEEAESAFREAIRVRPSYMEAHLELAGLLRADGQHAEAIEYYRRVLQFDLSERPEEFTIASFGLIQSLTQTGRTTEASRRIDELVDVETEHEDIWLHAARLRFQRDDIAGTIAAYREAIRLNPRNARVYHDLGVLYERDGDLREAERALREAIRLDPHYANAHYRLGTLLQRFGDRNGAIASYRAALRHDPTHDAATRRLRALEG